MRAEYVVRKSIMGHFNILDSAGTIVKRVNGDYQKARGIARDMNNAIKIEALADRLARSNSDEI